jgi:coenzyme Q-binding protein COQ10
MPTHDQHTTVPYRDDQLFDLVADVAKYPEFLPWCVAARLRSRTATEMVADLTIGFGPFRESFTSRVSLDRPRLVKVTYENGPFKYLHNTWDFTAVAQGCRVDFHVDFEFRNRLLSRAIGVVFQEAVRRMVAAFMKRARDIYGPPARVGVGGPVSATVKTEV